MNSNIYQIKISLEYIKPQIWRRLLIDGHLHEFEIHKSRYGSANPDYLSDVEDEDDFNLDELAKAGDKLFYEYDFGDGWRHLLKIEKVLPAKKDTFYPVCTDGKRACPPEDCGGFPGYMGLLEALKNPDEDDNVELIEWVGEDYDPEKFALDEVNQGLKRLYQD